MRKNMERLQYQHASKKEKARHNGVNVSMWGNDCPRIEVPEGWEDHQYTQQLIRKYLNNDFAKMDFASQAIKIKLRRDETLAMFGFREDLFKTVRLGHNIKGIFIQIELREKKFVNGVYTYTPEQIALLQEKNTGQLIDGPCASRYYVHAGGIVKEIEIEKIV